MKAYFLIVLLLLFFEINKINLKEAKNDDLTISDDEDDDIENEKKNKENGVKKPPKKDDSDDEFDDPDLLKSQNQKQSEKRREAKNQQKVKKEEPKKESVINETKKIYPKIKKKLEIKNVFQNYELIMGGILIIYILNVFYGKITNNNLAANWLLKNKQFFEENYAHLGGEKEYNPKSTSLLLKESYNSFKFFGSGRVFANWMLVNIETKKRQDLVYMLGSMFLFPEKDKILYESSLSPQNELPVIFCICKKNNAKTLKSTYDEIDKFCEMVNSPFLHNNLILLSENSEIIESLFKDKKFIEIYEKIEKYIDFVFYTDKRNNDKRDKNMIAIEFDISYMKEKDYDDLFNITLFAHYLIDFLCTINIKSIYKKEAENRRKEYDAQKSRELAEKNAEEIKNKKEEIKNSKQNKVLTVEQAQKLEDKERKEMIKNQNKKRFKMIKN